MKKTIKYLANGLVAICISESMIMSISYVLACKIQIDFQKNNTKF